MAQRAIEKSGIVTVSLTQMPYIAEKIGVPRAVAIEFPFSMIYGKPGDHSTQIEVLRHMLRAVEGIKAPGEIIYLTLAWPEEDVKKRDWFPTEPAPWAADQERMMEMVEFIQHGDPLE